MNEQIKERKVVVLLRLESALKSVTHVAIEGCVDAQGQASHLGP